MDEIVQEHTKSKFIGRILNNQPTVNYKFHWHENCEICRIINKPCQFLVDGQLIEAGVGDLIFFNEYTVHKFIITEDNTDTVIIQFPWRSVIQYDQPSKSIQMHITAEQIGRISGLEEKIDGLLQQILSEQRVEKEEKENPFLCSLIAALYYLLVRHFPAEKKSGAIKKDREEFYKVVAYIKDHFTEPLTVNQLAEAMYMSRAKLSALFQRYAGIGINEYINSLRIKKANFLLDQGNKITAAAMESGFQSVRTFNCVYKKHMGMTPSEFVQEVESK